MATTTKQSHSEQQAAAQLESIKGMVAALECDYERLEELREERDEYIGEDFADGATGTWVEACPDDAEELAELEAAAGECEDREEAERRIQEDPLSVEVRSGWYAPGSEDADKSPAEYCILLCTGGPACRIIGDLDGDEPTSARLQHQDWFTPWQEHITTGDDNAVLVGYARQFFYGE